MHGRCATPSGKVREQAGAVIGSEAYQQATVTTPLGSRDVGSLIRDGRVIADTDTAQTIMLKARSHARIEDAFHQADSKGNGVVTHQEFEKGLQRLGVVLPETKLVGLLAEFDPAGKGLVNYHDFAASVARTDIEAQTSSAPSPSGVPTVSRESCFFFAFLFLTYVMCGCV